MANSIIHVYQQRIRQNKNKAPKDRLPPIIVKPTGQRGKSNYVNVVFIRNKLTGALVGALMYTPDKPLKCGATVYLELNDNYKAEFQE